MHINKLLGMPPSTLEGKEMQQQLSFSWLYHSFLLVLEINDNSKEVSCYLGNGVSVSEKNYTPEVSSPAPVFNG